MSYNKQLVVRRVLEAQILSTYFKINEATQDGGAVSVSSFDNVTILTSNFTGNNAQDGGGLHIGKAKSSNVSISPTFQIPLPCNKQNSVVHVRSCNFTRNVARKNGGGAVVNKRFTKLFDSSKSNLEGVLSVHFLNCLFDRNKARNGGAEIINDLSLLMLL